MGDSSMVETILNIFDVQLGLPRPAPSTDLLADGVLDSLSLLDLLAEIETQTGVIVDLTSLDLADLESVATLAALVERSR